MLIGDCASDPPLGATARLLATTRADDVVFGLGALALRRSHGDGELALAVADGAARAALATAIARIGAAPAIRLLDVPDAWPGVTAAAGDTIVPAAALVALADEAHGRAVERWVTVAGAVATPALLAATADETLAALVARAGGALDADWVALAGGAPAGWLAARDDVFAAIGAPALLLVLPARHELVRRLRTPVATWLARAASACEGCRACSDASPTALAPATLVAALVNRRDDGVAAVAVAMAAASLAATSLAMASCSGCGLCDAMCPAALSPRALATATRDRLRANGVHAEPAAPARPGLDRALLTARLGLTAYERSPVLAPHPRATV
jgi:ferredoxin